MIRVSVQNEGTEFTVSVANTNLGYKRVFGVHRVKPSSAWGPPVEAQTVAWQRAVADAEDWVTKFRAAGLDAEVVSS